MTSPLVRFRYIVAIVVAFALGATGAQVAPRASAAVADLRDAQLMTPTIGWALTGSRLAWTEDGGASWRTITPAALDVSQVLDVFFVDALNGWVAARGTQLPIAPGSTTLVAYRTSNGGTTWTLSVVGVTDHGAPGTTHLTFEDALRGWMNVSLEGSSALGPSQLFATVDGGVTWAKRTSPARGRATGAPSRTWLNGGPGSFTTLHTSSDGGATWQPVEVPIPSAHAGADVVYGTPLALDGARAVLPLTYAGSVKPGVAFYTTADGGRTWTLAVDVATPTRISVGLPVATALIDASTWIAIPPRADTVYTVNVQTGAQAIPTQGLPPGVFEISFATREAGWATNFVTGPTQGRLFATSDGGRTWRELAP